MSEKQTSHERTGGLLSNQSTRVKIGIVVVLLIFLAGCSLQPPVEYDRDPEISLDSTHHVAPGETYNVSVEYNQTINGETEIIDITDEAEIESHDEDGLTVEDGNMLVATENVSYADRVPVTASYDDYTTTVMVSVATVDVANLEPLSPEWRFSALMGDATVRTLLVAIMTGVVAARWSTAFGGLGAMQGAVIMGWFAGWIPTGIMLVGLFMAMFIGFNLAANIDYTVHRG